MIDALLYAFRDYIRSLKIDYQYAECEIMADGKPTPRCGAWFAAIHSGSTRGGQANRRNLDELYDFTVTLTGRIVIPLDRVGDQMIARNLPLKDANDVPLALRQGFNARAEKIRTLLHMNWRTTVLTGQTPPSANDNLVAWLTMPSSPTEVYGFVEPGTCQGVQTPRLVGSEWFAAEPDSEEFGLAADLRCTGARRMQPQTASVGVFS